MLLYAVPASPPVCRGSQLPPDAVVRCIHMGSFVVVRDTRWGSNPAGEYFPPLPPGPRKRGRPVSSNKHWDETALRADRVQLVLDLGARAAAVVL